MAGRYAGYEDVMGATPTSQMKGPEGGSIASKLGSRLGSANQNQGVLQAPAMGTPSQGAQAMQPTIKFDQYEPEAVVSPGEALQRNMQFQGNPKFVNNRGAVANADLRDTMNEASQAGITYKGNPAYQGVINNYLDRMAPNRMQAQQPQQAYDEAAARRRLGSGGVMVGM